MLLIVLSLSFFKINIHCFNQFSIYSYLNMSLNMSRAPLHSAVIKSVIKQDFHMSIDRYCWKWDEWMNDSIQTARGCPPSCSDVRYGGWAISRYLNVRRMMCVSYLHHFCSIGTGSARRSPAPRQTPRRTSWSPSVWSIALARGNLLSPPPLWLRGTPR